MPPSPPAPAPSLAVLLNLVAQIAFGLLAMTICIPSMQDWPTTFGASQALVQLTFSAFVAAYGGLQLVWGPVSDRIGRKPVLLAGLALALAGLVAAALAPSLGWLIAARTVQGAGVAAGMVTGRALVQDLFVGSERTRAMAFIGMAMGLCPPLATIVGGQLHVRVGWQAGFLLMSGVGAVLFVAAWRGLPAAAARPAARSGGPGLVAGYTRLLREPAFPLYVLMLASTTAAFYSFLAGAPVVLKQYGVTPERVGFYIMAVPFSYMTGNLLTSRLVQRHGERSILWAGQLFTCLGAAGVLLLGLAGFASPLALAAPLLLLGLGHGFLAPPTLAGTVGLVPALAGSAAAIGGLIQQLSGALGGWIVGLVQHEGQIQLGALMLGWTALGLVAQSVLHGVVQTTRRPRPA